MVNPTYIGEQAIRILKDLSLAILPGIVGVEWNQVTDTWRRIDPAGNPLPSFPHSFNYIYPWAGMRRVTMAANGAITAVGDGKGTGLDLTGANGRVMVQIPKFYVKSSRPAPNVYQRWISPITRAGFVVHPAFVQRGGIERDFIYVGAYNADFDYDGVNEAYNPAHEKLHSRTAKQPYTGNTDCIWSIPIDDLAFEPAIGNECSTPTEGGFFIVDYLKTGGAWGGGTAGDTAIIWLRKPGDATCGMLNAEVLTNVTLANIIGNTTAGPTGKIVTITASRTLIGNIGAGWGLSNIWSLSAVQFLFYLEYAGANSQTLVGKGIVDKAGGVGFAGEISGFNGIDANLAVNGTGTGVGVNGLTPVAYRGIENLWGNIWQFIDGYNALDAEYRIIKRDGSGAFADPLAAGQYEASLAAPIVVNGYISNIVYEDLLKYIFIAAAIVGSSGTYLYDYWYAHVATQTNILLAGGDWNHGVDAGVGCRSSYYVAAYAYRNVGARLEFIG